MRGLGFRGFSLTIPHKERALALADELSPEAAAIGAVNTALNGNGRIRGENTDWIGVKEAFGEAKVELRGRRVLVMGAGGAAKAALYAAQKGDAASVKIWNRTSRRANVLAEAFGCTAITTLGPDALGEADVVINATPIGGPDRNYPFPLSALTSRHAVLDMVTVETPLLGAARRCGGTAVPGIRMLLFQGLRQFELFTGAVAPRAAMERALMTEYSQLSK
jgi:shikimate dehydrogenase